MTATCPNGHAVEPGARFCSECGAALAGLNTPATQADAEPGATTDDPPALGAGTAPNDDEAPMFVMSDPLRLRHGSRRWKPFALVGAITGRYM